MNSKKIKTVTFVVFVVLHLLYMVLWGTEKINYHVDEYYTYGLANNRGSIEPVLEDGEVYDDDTVFINYLAPDESERFDYSIVWENQAKDVHPPLYYIFVHTICSFFPFVFSKWEALCLNLVFLIAVDILVYFVAKRLFKNGWIPFWAVVINGMTLLCLNTVLFLRMYALMTIFVLGIAGLFLKYWDRKLDWKFYLLLFVLSVGGALTQYYFLIYLFFSVLVFEIIRLIKHRWGKETILSLVVLVGAGVTSILTFPAMLEQIFGSGYRGQQAFDNVRTLADVPQHIAAYARIINDELFGGCAILILLFAISAFALLLSHERKWDRVLELSILAIPAVFYTLVISVVAPYQYDRYIMAVGPLVVLTAIWLIYQTMDYVCQESHHTAVNAVICGIFGIMILSSMSIAGWDSQYTYQSTKGHVEVAKAYEDCRALFVYNAPWTVNDKMQELIHYQDYVFLKEQEVADYAEVEGQDEMVLYISNTIKAESVISSIQKNNPKLTEVKTLYKDVHPVFASAYYLSGE